MKRFFILCVPLFLYGAFIFSVPVAEAFTLTKGGNQLALVGWWTFDGKDMAPNVRDTSGQGNHGNLLGQVATTTVAGKLGQALQFNSSSETLDLGDVPNSYNVGALTVSVWQKTSASGGRMFISKLISGFDVWALGRNGFDQIYFEANNTSGDSVFAISDAAYSDGNWHHVVGVYDGAHVFIYVDGVSADATPPVLTGNIKNRADHVCVNGTYDAFICGGSATGAIDDLRIYNRALSANEVRALYATGAGSKLGAITHAAAESALLGWWTLDGKNTPWSSATAGTALDSSGLGNTGTLTGMNSSSATVAGKSGQALVFDGVNDEVALPNVTSLTDNVSFSVWAYWLDTAGIQIPLSFGNTGTNGYGFIIGNNSCGSGNKLTIFLGGVSCDALSGSSYTMPTGQWVHLTGVREATTWKLYVNGALQQSGGTVAPNTPTTLSSIGNGTFHGYLDDARIFNKALSAAEVGAQYNQERGAKQGVAVAGTNPSGLVGWWTFDGKDISGTTVLDRSGQGDNAILYTEATVYPTRIAGKIGQGISTVFDNTNRPIIYTNTKQQPQTALSASTWLRVDSLAGIYSADSIISAIDNSASYMNFSFDETSKYIQASMFQNGNAGVYISRKTANNAVTLNTWNHVAYTWDGGTTDASIKIYVNGVQADTTNTGSGTFTAPYSGSGLGFRIGSLAYNGYYNVGNTSFDDVRIYSRALSATEIRQLYNLGR